MQELTKFRGEHRMILWTQLNVDTSYQRDLSQTKVNKISRIFDPDAFGELVIGQRADGTYWIVDGQHRWKAMQSMGWTNQNVPCWVLLGTTPEEEAELFDLFNGNRGMPRVADRFKARLRHGDEQAKTIEQIVHDSGYQLHFSLGTPPRFHIGAINAIIEVYERGKPGDLMKVLTICRETWNGEPQSVSGDLIKAIHRFTSRYRDQFEMAVFIERLKGTSPSLLIGKGRQIADIMGTTVNIGVSRALLQSYNHNRRTGRLPEWEGGQVDEA